MHHHSQKICNNIIFFKHLQKPYSPHAVSMQKICIYMDSTCTNMQKYAQICKNMFADVVSSRCFG